MSKYRTNRAIGVMLLLLAVLLAAFSFAFTAAAQDSTTPEVAPAVTAEPTVVSPVNVNITTASDATRASPEGNVSLPFWSVIVVIVVSIGGGLALPQIIDRIRTNPAAIAEIETRAEELPSAVTDILMRIAETGESGARLLREAVDKIPAASKPPEPAFDIQQVDFVAFSDDARRRGYALIPLQAAVTRPNTGG